ncbi:MAG: SDR family NAD(P)-dependent oxidoreductase [Gemmataceae bacterium]
MKRMDPELTNKVVLVTGSSGGIGDELAREFARHGARVVAHFNQNSMRAKRLVSELGSSCLAIKANLSCEPEVDRLFSEVESKWGPVEILIANAGKWPSDPVPLHEMSLERWNNTLADNLTSVFLSLKGFLQGAKRNRLEDPSAVLIGSTAGIIGEANHADYAAAKSALILGLCKSVKNEMCHFAPRGRINVVCPGWTSTSTRPIISPSENLSRVLQTIPLRKIANPGDIATACVFLASTKLAGHITGEYLTIAGGMEGRMLYRTDETML